MKFAIISHAVHKKEKNKYFSYAPYVKEMNIWLKYVEETIIVAPLVNDVPSKIDLAYEKKNINYISINSIALTSATNAIKSLFRLPLILLKIFKACKQADHIHLRCPGNIGLLGCFVQILFPSKPKTIKYAGNWDPKSKQPLSYKIQKWIISSTFLTKNCKVLVYGKWENQSKNIVPFFTASFSNNDRQRILLRNYKSKLRFLFVGTLSEGKRPLYAIKLIHELIKQNIDLQLDIYGEGIMRTEIENYIHKNNIEKHVVLHGNAVGNRVKNEYKTAHFLILPSKSEGWPKVVAEAMFYGCIPIVTSISCVPYMVDNGNRGLLMTTNLIKDVNLLKQHLLKSDILNSMAERGATWSQKFTLEYFESELKKLLAK